MLAGLLDALVDLLALKVFAMQDLHAECFNDREDMPQEEEQAGAGQGRLFRAQFEQMYEAVQ